MSARGSVSLGLSPLSELLHKIVRQIIPPIDQTRTRPADCRLNAECLEVTMAQSQESRAMALNLA
jgi:hypothetical protein